MVVVVILERHGVRRTHRFPEFVRHFNAFAENSCEIGPELVESAQLMVTSNSQLIPDRTLTLVGPAPFLLLLSRNTRWVLRNLGPVILVGAMTIVLSVAGGKHGWPAWVAAASILVVPTGYLVARGCASVPVRLTRRRAARLLRRRGGGTANAWSDGEWEWAFTQIGTPIALHQAARCQERQSLLGTTELTTKRAALSTT